MKKQKKVILVFFIIINFLLFYFTGYMFTANYKQYLDFTYKKAITQAYKYISDIETTIFYYT